MAINYCKSWFFLDVISSVPVNLIMVFNFDKPAVSLQLIKLIKAISLYRLLTIGKYLKITTNNKIYEWLQSKISISRDVVELYSNLFRMLILIHFIGCAWAIIGTILIADERDNWFR